MSDEIAVNENSILKPYLKRKCKAFVPAFVQKASKHSQTQIIKRPNQEEDFTITHLPNEIIDLFKLELVNKRLNDAVKNIAWPKVNKLNLNDFMIPKVYNFRQMNVKATLKYFKAVLSRSSIKFLVISDKWNFPLMENLTSLLPFIPQAISLNFSYKTLSNESIIAIANNCPMLEEITLIGCFHNVGIENGLEIIFKKCPNLNYINLSKNGGTNGKCFQYLPKQLRYLNLAECYHLDIKSLNHLPEQTKNLETLILYGLAARENINIWLHKLTKLRFLEISHMKGAFSPLDFSILQELEMLSICTNKLLTIESIKGLQNLPKLKTLDLSYNFQFDGNIILEILRKCKNLKCCDLSGLENLNNNIVDFVQFTQMKYLAINRCNNFTDDVVKSLISECNSLTHLEMVYTNFNHTLMNKDFFKTCPMRRQILNLVVYTGSRQSLQSHKWFKFHEWNGFMPEESPFADFIKGRLYFLYFSNCFKRTAVLSPSGKVL